jgi:hypothetical protein
MYSAPAFAIVPSKEADKHLSFVIGHFPLVIFGRELPGQLNIIWRFQMTNEKCQMKYGK